MDGILELAYKLRTSITCTAIRYATLGIRPIALVKWHKDSVAWKWFSGDVREAGFRTVIDKFSKLPEGTATARALENEKISKAFFSNATTAAAWFPWVSDSSPKNVLFIEEAIQLGRFGVLTVLRPEAGHFDFDYSL